MEDEMKPNSQKRSEAYNKDRKEKKRIGKAPIFGRETKEEIQKNIDKN
jgi:hypothetical protein